MAVGNEYSEYLVESLEREMKLWTPFRRGVAYRNWNGRLRVEGVNSRTRLPRLQGQLNTHNWRRIRLSSRVGQWSQQEQCSGAQRWRRCAWTSASWDFKRCLFFLEHDGCITGKVTGRRWYCHQRGGMEIPCELLFVGKWEHIQKLKSYS